MNKNANAQKDGRCHGHVATNLKRSRSHKMNEGRVASPVELKISFVPGQPAQVSGPLYDKMLCYAMLEIARDAVKDYKPVEQPLIEPARIVALPSQGNGRGG